MENFIDRNVLTNIENFINVGLYNSAVRESCTLLEVVLRKVFQQALLELPFNDRQELLRSEREIGNDKKGYQEFGFGQLVGLFKKSQLLRRWGEYTHSNLGLISSINFDYIVELRNRMAHYNPDQNPCTYQDAMLVYNALTNWLSFIGYKEIDKGIEKAFKEEKETENNKQIKRYEKVKRKIHSDYDSSNKKEARRLRMQSNYSLKFDEESFHFVLEKIKKKEHLIGLDVGCADGYVTELRFKEEYPFDKVIGLDFNEKVIQKVNESDHGHFHYYQMDLESKDFEDKMDEILEEMDIDGFDVIFSALTLHHLKNPQRCLMNLRKYLNKGGAIILRGVDDGGMMAYDDNGLVDKILDETLALENASDRFHGRKFYTYLCNAGFKEVEMRYLVDDTTKMEFEEKEDFFRYYFDFRKAYTMRAMNAHPEDKNLKKKHEQMVEDLEKLEEIFMKPDFFFCTLTVSAIAFK